MMRYIIEFEHMDHRNGSGYDSNSGMNDWGGYYWVKEVKVFDYEDQARAFYNQWFPNESFYRNWKCYQAFLEDIKFQIP